MSNKPRNNARTRPPGQGGGLRQGVMVCFSCATISKIAAQSGRDETIPCAIAVTWAPFDTGDGMVSVPVCMACLPVPGQQSPLLVATGSIR